MDGMIKESDQEAAAQARDRAMGSTRWPANAGRSLPGLAALTADLRLAVTS
jgi:hypothetical protein